MSENELAQIVFSEGMQLHRELGPGLLESIYEECLYRDLKAIGLSVSRQQKIPLIYKGEKLGTAFRADLIINDKLLIELKTVSTILDVHKAQTLSYLKLSNIKLGLLINFNSALFKNGVRRIINGSLYED